MISLVTFCTPNMSRAADLCISSAREHGADSTLIWTQDALRQTAFYRENQALLDQPRGAGYWAYKPFVLLEEMAKLADGDFVIWCDAGVEIIDNLFFIIDRMAPGEDMWLFGNHYAHLHWCKADTLNAIAPEIPWEAFDRQCQASVLVFRVSDRSRAFVSEWLKYCLEPHLIDDSPSIAANHVEFAEHRHDQSIATCLAYKYGIGLHWWPAIYNYRGSPEFVYQKSPFERDAYPALFSHHRFRNHEFPSEWERK